MIYETLEYDSGVVLNISILLCVVSRAIAAPAVPPVMSKGNIC